MSAMTFDLAPTPDEQAIHRGLLVSHAAGGALLLAGLLHAASVMQLALFAWQDTPIVLGEVVFAGFAVAHLFAGSRAYDASTLFTGAGAAVAGGGAGFAAVWFLYLLSGGALALLPMIVAAGGGLTALLCLAALPFAVKVSAARQALIDG